MHTPRDTATLLAVILIRSKQTRARVSTITIKILAKRRLLRSAFILELSGELADLSWIFFELASGGFAAVQAKALEAAKPVTVRRFLKDEERRKLNRGDDMDWDALRREVEPHEEEPGDAD
jgi:hypothetical protein